MDAIAGKYLCLLSHWLVSIQVAAWRETILDCFLNPRSNIALALGVDINSDGYMAEGEGSTVCHFIINGEGGRLTHRNDDESDPNKHTHTLAHTHTHTHTHTLSHTHTVRTHTHTHTLTHHLQNTVWSPTVALIYFAKYLRNPTLRRRRKYRLKFHLLTYEQLQVHGWDLFEVSYGFKMVQSEAWHWSQWDSVIVVWHQRSA